MAVVYLLLLQVVLYQCHGFLIRPIGRCMPQSLTMRAAAELSGDTLWRVAIKLQKQGSKSSEAVARVRFVPDKNYEPPQGRGTPHTVTVLPLCDSSKPSSTLLHSSFYTPSVY
jgi:hypothetical protein